MPLDKKNPITVENLFYNILGKAGEFGRGYRIKFVEGDVVGVPFEPSDEKGFRNLLHMAIGMADDEKPVLRVHLNQGVVTNAFNPPDHDGWWKIVNSTFVWVEDARIGGEKVLCVNLIALDPAPTPTPTPTPTPPL